MRRPRITIAALLGIVAFVAVAFAARREPTDGWDSGVLGVILVTLLTSVLLAVHRTSVRRAYWIGFALFGWAYLGLTLVPPLEARLPTEKVLVLGWEMMSGPGDAQDNLAFARPPGNGMNPAASASPSNTGPPGQWDVVVFTNPGTSATTNYIKRLVALPGGTAENFMRIGHSLLALILALVGGSLSRRLYSSGQPGRDGEPDVPRQSPAESVDA